MTMLVLQYVIKAAQPARTYPAAVVTTADVSAGILDQRQHSSMMVSVLT